MTEYPKSKFLAMAGFDTVASLLTFIPAAFISGDLMILLLQMVIPITLAASVFYLKKRCGAELLLLVLALTGCARNAMYICTSERRRRLSEPRESYREQRMASHGVQLRTH